MLINPIKRHIIQIVIPLYNLKDDSILMDEFRIKSPIDILIMILNEKARQNVINLFILDFLILKKTTIDPKTVDNPAILEINKEYSILIDYHLPYLNLCVISKYYHCNYEYLLLQKP